MIDTDLREHPAVDAWLHLRPAGKVPAQVERLTGREGEIKRTVYRLRGVGTRGTAVVAKCCHTASAHIERLVYEEILCRLPVTAPRYYGFVEENAHTSWIFLNDVGRQQYAPLADEERALAAEWLGRLHVTAAPLAGAAQLPDQGPAHYLAHLREARDAIRRNRRHPELTDRHGQTLDALARRLDELEICWSALESFAASCPRTLVHGDFSPKNVYVQSQASRRVLLPIDWETAGWGIPAVDLAPACGYPMHCHVDLAIYQRAVNACWPDLTRRVLEGLVEIGRVFRLLAAIHWEALSLDFAGIENSMVDLAFYDAELAEVPRLMA